jgi:hypothetical protein
VEHAANELELYRSLVAASGIWPAVWLVNSFWGPLGDVHRLLAPVMGPVRPDFQPTMERLLTLIEGGDDVGAELLVHDWFAGVDRDLVAILGEVVAAVSASQSAPRAGDHRTKPPRSTEPP